jgi:hypothetical protein
LAAIQKDFPVEVSQLSVLVVTGVRYNGVKGEQFVITKAKGGQFSAQVLVIFLRLDFNEKGKLRGTV